MQITINTGEPLSDLDVAVLTVLLGDNVPAVSAQPVATTVTINNPEPKAEKVKAAPKAEPKVESTPEPKAEPKVESTPEPEAEAEEDLLGGGKTYTMDDAVNAATKLVSNGEAAKVKAALAAVGAKRVSEVSAENLAKFIESIQD